MKRSVTLVEIIVSSIILATVFAVFISAFITTRKYVWRANRRIVANNWVRSASNYLYKEMAKPSGSSSSAFSAGQHGLPFNDTDYPLSQRSEIVVDGVVYSGFYDVVYDAGSLNITFNVTYESVD